MQIDESYNTLKFESLSYGTLRRYQSFFNITNDEIKKDKEALINSIKNHFNNMEINTENVIETFVSIEKDQNNEKNNSLRKSIRFQEKSMAKFLDSFNTLK
jgi:hypothetical protein